MYDVVCNEDYKNENKNWTTICKQPMSLPDVFLF